MDGLPSNREPSAPPASYMPIRLKIGLGVAAIGSLIGGVMHYNRPDPSKKNDVHSRPLRPEKKALDPEKVVHAPKQAEELIDQYIEAIETGRVFDFEGLMRHVETCKNTRRAFLRRTYFMANEELHGRFERIVLAVLESEEGDLMHNEIATIASKDEWPGSPSVPKDLADAPAQKMIRRILFLIALPELDKDPLQLLNEHVRMRLGKAAAKKLPWTAEGGLPEDAVRYVLSFPEGAKALEEFLLSLEHFRGVNAIPGPNRMDLAEGRMAHTVRVTRLRTIGHLDAYLKNLDDETERSNLIRFLARSLPLRQPTENALLAGGSSRRAALEGLSRVDFTEEGLQGRFLSMNGYFARNMQGIANDAVVPCLRDADPDIVQNAANVLHALLVANTPFPVAPENTIQMMGQAHTFHIERKNTKAAEAIREILEKMAEKE